MPSPVKAAAQRLGIPVVHTVDESLTVGADLGVVVAFGQLIKPPALAALPMVNLHFSLLPRWRGAAPVERALLAGDAVTGVCLMQLEAGLDTGPVHAMVEVPIDPRATGDSLRAELVASGPTCWSTDCGPGSDRRCRRRASRRTRPSSTPTISGSTGRRRPVERDRQVRLGGAWTMFRDKRFKVHEVELLDPDATGADIVDAGTGAVGGLRLITVQPEGKAPMPYRDFANGARPTVGEHFT